MKHIARIFLIALTLILLSVWAAADADSHSLSIQRLLINEDGSISMIVHTTAEGEIPASRFSLLVGETEVSVDEIEAYKRTDRGTTFLVLSDVSTIGATKGVKAIASGIINQLDSDDNAGFLVNGYTSEQIAVSDRALELKNLIDGDLFKRNTSAKNLYETASIALNFLNQHNAVKSRPCLILLSTGENKTQSGITIDELRQQIEDSGVTVYTVTFRNEKPTSQINTYESLARASCGGTAISVRYSPNDNDFNKALEQFQEQEAQFRLLTFAPGAQMQAGSEISLTLKDGDYTLSDTVTMSAAQYAQYQEILAAQKSSSSSDDTNTGDANADDTNTEYPEQKPFPIVPVAGGAVVVVLVLILLLKKKKKPADDIPPQPESDVEIVSESDEDPEYESEPGLEPEYEPDPESEPKPEPPVLHKLPLHIVLASQTGDRRIYEGDMDRTLLIGRDHNHVDIVVNPHDTTISGIHLRLSYQNGIMTAQDVSRNGTSVNNTRIKAPTVIQQNVLLTLGRTTLRITWFPNQD